MRICDLTGQLAGAGATKILAALGAEVIRVEDPVRNGLWDVTRRSLPFVDDRRGINLSGQFNNHNAGKLGVTLDLRLDSDRERFRRLVASSDVVTENFAAGVMERLGFGYHTLRAIHPDIIYISNCGFGHTGPLSAYKTFGPAVQAFCGLTSLSGLPGLAPAGWGYSYMDHLGADFMAVAVMAALVHRDRTGEGQWVDMACTEAGIGLTGPSILDYTLNGRSARRPGQPDSNRSLWQGMSPHNVYPALGDDNWVAVACRDDDDWSKMAAVIDEPWAVAVELATTQGRMACSELDDRISDWTRGRDHGETAARLRSVGVPASIVARPRDRIDLDPFTSQWGLWPTVEHPEIGKVRVEGLPLHFSVNDWSITAGAPCLGQHNESVFARLPDTASIEGSPRQPGLPQGYEPPLNGVTVLEIASDHTALAGKLLGDLGADVIVVEPPAGHRSRSYGPFVDDSPDPNSSLWWWTYNTSKRSICLELTDPADTAALRSLIGSVDVVLEGGDLDLDAAGIGYAAFVETHPHLVWVSTTPFGLDHVRNHEPATDLTLMAGGGPVWSCGYDDHTLPPVRPGENHSNHIGGVWALIGALAALFRRNRSVAGQLVDVSIHAALNVTCEAATTHWLVAGCEVQRQTGRHAWINPTGPRMFETRDGRYLTIGTPPRTGPVFEALIEWLESLGLSDQIADSVFLDLGARETLIPVPEQTDDPEYLAMAAAGIEAISAIALHLESTEFFAGAQRRGITASVVNTPDEAMTDAHIQARRFPASVVHEDIGRTVTYAGAPFRMAGSPWRISRRPPRVGEHNEEICSQLESSPGIASSEMKGDPICSDARSSR